MCELVNVELETPSLVWMPNISKLQSIDPEILYEQKELQLKLLLIMMVVLQIINLCVDQ